MSPRVLIFIAMIVIESLMGKKAKQKKADQKKEGPLKDKKDSYGEKGIFEELKKEYYKMKSELNLEKKQTNMESKKPENKRRKVETQNKMRRDKREEFERVKDFNRKEQDLKDKAEIEKKSSSIDLNKKNMRKNIINGVIFSEILGEPKSRKRRKRRK